MPGVPEEVAQEFSGVVALLQQAMSNFPKGAPAGDEGTEGEPNLDEEAPEEMQMAAKAIVAKVGAKMSKERLSRFAQAINVLGSIFSELQGAGAAGEGGAAPAPAGKAKDPKEKEDKKKADEDEEKKKAAKADDPVLQAIGRLAGIVQKQGERIDNMAKTRGGGNAVTVEKGTPTQKPEAEVSWPLDMNNAVTRDSVAKAESFFDE
jgi:hypothetical protein